MEVSSQAVRTLMEVGVAAAGAGLSSQAATIFAGIDAVRPRSEAPVIGAALLLMNSNKAEEAVKVLRDEALSRAPDSTDVKKILALALQMAGHNAECDAVLKELQASGDASAKAFAAAVMEK